MVRAMCRVLSSIELTDSNMPTNTNKTRMELFLPVRLTLFIYVQSFEFH